MKLGLKMSPRNKFVLISDLHFNEKTLRLASQSLRAAVKEAENLQVDLIIAGDLNDSKSIIRGEVANEIINILSHTDVTVSILVGNHDLLNEKGNEHGLNYLGPYARIIDKPQYVEYLDVWMIPYQNSTEKMIATLDRIPTGAKIIMHQGVKEAFMGEYVQDKTSIDAEMFKDYKVLSGHYHQHQTVGTVTYIGTSYTVTSAEHADGPKGFLVVNDDHSFEQIRTNLRKHVMVNREIHTILDPIHDLNPEDLLHLKVTGPQSELDALDKKVIGIHHLGHQNFKFDPIPTEIEKFDTAQALGESENVGDIMDLIIEQSDEGPEQQTYLKGLWRDLADAS